MEISKSGSICILESASMIRPNAEDKQVVGQGPRYALHRPHKVGPGVQQECHKGHAQRAPLGYAAGVKVGLRQAACNSIVEAA